MAVPKRKTSKMKGRKRRTHYVAHAPALSLCPRCKRTLRPHTACPGCGYYRGRKILNILTKEEKKKAQDEARLAEKP
jgi:large subunit ribosomal protein L32